MALISRFRNGRMGAQLTTDWYQPLESESSEHSYAVGERKVAIVRSTCEMAGI